ncbi:MAG: GAF domain-containing protein [Patescibacteria group bacterium]
MRRYEAMAEIAKIIMTDKPMKEKLQKIAELICESLEIDRCAIAQIKNGDTYEYIAGVATFGLQHGIGKPHAISNCPTIQEVITTEKMVVIEDPLQDIRTEYMRDLVITIDIKSILFAPVFIKGDVGFVIVIDAIKEMKKFEEDDIIFIKHICDIISDLRKHDQRIKHTNRLLTQTCVFEASAHELRNPATSAMGLCRRVLKKVKEKYPGDETFKKLSVSCMQSLEKFEEVMKNLFSTDVNSFSTENANLNELIVETVKKINNNANIITTNLANNLPNVKVDNSRLAIAFDLLLKNIIEEFKINKTEEKEQTIKIITVRKPSSVRLIISAPIKIAKPDQFFEPNIYVGTTKDDLSRSIIKSIIESHNGASIKVWQNNEANFVINFPI